MKIPENFKLILISVLPLFIVIVLFFFVGRFAIEKISEVRLKEQAQRKVINTLNNKLNILSQTSFNGNESPVLNSLPERNPSMLIVSQLKRLSGANGLFISNIKGGAETKDPSGLSKVDITFDVEGARPQVINMLFEIGNIAPITLLDKIKIGETDGKVRATIQVKGFWSPLPQKISTVTEQISDFTANENKIIEEVSKLIQPNFVEVPAQEPAAKADPFSF